MSWYLLDNTEISILIVWVHLWGLLELIFGVGYCPDWTVWGNNRWGFVIIWIRYQIKCPPPSGLVSLSDWASAVESVMHLGLPWRMLRYQLVTSKLVTSNHGMIDFHEWFNELAIAGPNTDVRTLHWAAELETDVGHRNTCIWLSQFALIVYKLCWHSNFYCAVYVNAVE